MSPAIARALAQAYELQRLLREVEEDDSNPPVENAIDSVDEVIRELEGLLPEVSDAKTAHEVRLLVTEPGQFVQLRVGQAMRKLATKPWRRL
jgi:hypothetical protein